MGESIEDRLADIEANAEADAIVLDALGKTIQDLAQKVDDLEREVGGIGLAVQALEEWEPQADA